MKIVELFDSVNRGIYYHGTNKDFKVFDLGAERANRGSNVTGIYFTPRENEARTYGSRVVAAELNVSKPFYSNRKNLINDAMQKAYSEWLSRNTYHPRHWIKDVLVPTLVDKGNLSMMDMSGDVKRELLLAGGYDSFVDGDHVVVLNPSSRTIKEIV